MSRRLLSVEITAKDAKNAKGNSNVSPVSRKLMVSGGHKEAQAVTIESFASFASLAVQSLWKYTRVFHDLGRGLPLMRVSVQHYTR